MKICMHALIKKYTGIRPKSFREGHLNNDVISEWHRVSRLKRASSLQFCSVLGKIQKFSGVSCLVCSVQRFVNANFAWKTTGLETNGSQLVTD